MIRVMTPWLMFFGWYVSRKFFRITLRASEMKRKRDQEVTVKMHPRPSITRFTGRLPFFVFSILSTVFPSSAPTR